MSAADNPIEAMIEEALTDVEELLTVGRVRRADELAEKTGVELSATTYPMYFTGDVEAEIVLVHLNPKLRRGDEGITGKSDLEYATFDEYLDGHERFGYLHWCCDPDYTSAFDYKQVRFLRPFGVIDFVAEENIQAKRTNAERACDRKLQMELVPYASVDFPTSRFSTSVLTPHFERLLGVIRAHPRRYVLLCGAVFDRLFEELSPYPVLARDDHSFKLRKKDGSLTRLSYRFANLLLDVDGIAVHVGLALSFAAQGLPMTGYAEECARLYLPPQPPA